jgi:hypothetical protein
MQMRNVKLVEVKIDYTGPERTGIMFGGIYVRVMKSY